MEIRLYTRNQKKVMAKKFDNRFIPKYIPNDLPWYEKDGLDTWYLQNKCKDFLKK